MATTNYPPDPYNGWRNINPASNVPASRIFLDTSGSWRLISPYGLSSVYRVYQQSQGLYY